MISSLSQGVGEERTNRSRKTIVHRGLECAQNFRGMDVSSQVLINGCKMCAVMNKESGCCSDAARKVQPLGFRNEPLASSLTRSSRVQVPSWRITQRDSNEKAKQTSRLGVQQLDLIAHNRAGHVTRRVHESKIRKKLEQNKHRQETCEPVKCSALQGQPRAITSQVQHRTVVRELKKERGAPHGAFFSKSEETSRNQKPNVTTEPSFPGARTHHEVRIPREDGAIYASGGNPSRSRKPT